MGKIEVIGGDLETGSWEASFQLWEARMSRDWGTKIVDLERLKGAEVQTEEKLKVLASSAGWGFAGALVGGALTGGIGLLIGGLAGVLSGGNKSEVCFSCELQDGRKFLAITDQKIWQQILVLKIRSESTNATKINEKSIGEDLVTSSSLTSPNAEEKAELLLEAPYTDSKIQQVIQNALITYKVLVKVNREKEQLRILLDREASNYLDYLEISETIESELTKLKLKDIESVTISGRVTKAKTLDFKKLLKPAYDVWLENIGPLQTKSVISILTTPSLEEMLKGSTTPRLTTVQAEKLIKSLPALIKVKIDKLDAENEEKRFKATNSNVSLKKTNFYLGTDLPFSATEAGDPGQIENVLNLSFQKEGTSVTVSRKAGLLQVMLESIQAPVQKTSVLTVRKDMIRLGLDVKSIKSMRILGQQIGSKSPAWDQTLDLLYKEDRNNLIAAVGCLSVPLVAIVWFLFSIISKPTPSAVQTPTPAPLPTPQRTFLGQSQTGYELWLGSNDCVYVKDLREADLNRLGSNIWEFKDAVKQETGKRCVFFE